MDNARLHKTRRAQELIEASGAQLMFLSPYSPDYNPIEHDLVSNIKRH
jgi:putative transposase